MSRSITPAPSGSLSPDFITVPSSTGFSAGDYVYQKNGDFGVPPATTSANFNVTPTSPIYGATVGGNSTLVNWSWGANSANAYRGGSVGQCAAKLSDGNIVIGYAYNGVPYFRIVDTNNVEVVAPVAIVGAASQTNSPIGVIALVGGGFVVHYMGNSGVAKPGYGVYTNTGTVTTAFAVDATAPVVGTTSKAIAGCALPNGGFALAYISTTPTLLTRAFNSTGIGAYAWTSLGAASSATGPVGLAARSDNSTLITRVVTASALDCVLLNGSGGTITNQTITVSTTPYQTTAACLTDDTFVIGYMFDPTLSPKFRLLPTGNVLSGPFDVPITNMLTTNFAAATAPIFIKELSSGGFVYLVGDAGGGMFYTFYTAAGTAVYSVPKACFDINCFQTNPGGYIGMVEISGYLSLYHTGAWATSAGHTTSALFNTKISLTNYSLLAVTGTTTPVGAVSASSGAYARATSLPMKAAYLAANTEALTLNQAISTGSAYTVAPSSVSGNTVNTIHSTTLPDGRFAIVYKDITTSAISFNVYSITGILQTTVAVGTGGTAKSYYVRIAALPSGRIAVAYMDAANNTINVNMYSTGFALTNTSTITPVTGSALFSMAGIGGVSGVGSDRLAVAYANTNGYPTVRIYDNALTTIQTTASFVSNASNYYVGIAAGPAGSYWVAWSGSAAAATVAWVIPNLTATNYATQFSFGATNGYQTQASCPIAVNSTGMGVVISASAATQASMAMVANNSSATLQTSAPTAFTTASFGDGNQAIGVTGAGTFVYFGSGNATANLYGFSGVFPITSASALHNGLLSGVTIASSNMQACITPSYGYNAVIAWINSSNIAQYAIVNAYPFNATQAITAGVTGSAPTTPLNISQSSGYYLAGVAVSDCPAGGTGQIQTNGVANLNSQYSTSTAFQGFDFQNPVTVGVKGTAVGRTVTMIKD